MERFKKITKCKEELKNLYLISDKGRVFSLQTNKFLKAQDNRSGYYFVYLKNNNITQKCYIHRLVALHFIPNKNKKPFINHLDCNPANNSFDNLEWCTNNENIQYAKSLGRFIKTDEWKQKISDGHNKTAVVSVDLDTNEVRYFKSIDIVAKYGFQPSCVCQCCKGIRNTHKNKKWYYLENYEK